jgi:hypothetical protein
MCRLRTTLSDYWHWNLVMDFGQGYCKKKYGNSWFCSHRLFWRINHGWWCQQITTMARKNAPDSTRKAMLRVQVIFNLGSLQFRFGNYKRVVINLESCWASGININPGHCKEYTSNQYNMYLYLFSFDHPLGVGVEVDSEKTFRRTGLHQLSPTSGFLVSIATAYTSCIWLHRLTPFVSWYKLIIGLYLMHMAASFDPLYVLV